MSAPGGPYAGRKRGRPWLAWLIILIIIGFIIWLIVAYAAGSYNRPAQTAPAGGPPAAAPITDLAAIVGASNRQALAGRTVSLNNLTVGDVVGSQGFWIGTDGERLFVRTPNPQRVNRGQIVSVGGTLENVPGDPQQEWNVDPVTARMISQEGVYLLAGNVAAGRPPQQPTR